MHRKSNLTTIEKDVDSKKLKNDPFSESFCVLTRSSLAIEETDDENNDERINKIGLNLRLRTNIINAQINALLKDATEALSKFLTDQPEEIPSSTDQLRKKRRIDPERDEHSGSQLFEEKMSAILKGEKLILYDNIPWIMGCCDKIGEKLIFSLYQLGRSRRNLIRKNSTNVSIGKSIQFCDPVIISSPVLITTLRTKIDYSTACAQERETMLTAQRTLQKYLRFIAPFSFAKENAGTKRQENLIISDFDHTPITEAQNLIRKKHYMHQSNTSTEPSTKYQKAADFGNSNISGNNNDDSSYQEYEDLLVEVAPITKVFSSIPQQCILDKKKNTKSITAIPVSSQLQLATRSMPKLITMQRNNIKQNSTPFITSESMTDQNNHTNSIDTPQNNPINIINNRVKLMQEKLNSSKNKYSSTNNKIYQSQPQPQNDFVEEETHIGAKSSKLKSNSQNKNTLIDNIIQNIYFPDLEEISKHMKPMGQPLFHPRTNKFKLVDDASELLINLQPAGRLRRNLQLNQDSCKQNYQYKSLTCNSSTWPYDVQIPKDPKIAATSAATRPPIGFPHIKSYTQLIHKVKPNDTSIDQDSSSSVPVTDADEKGGDRCPHLPGAMHTFGGIAVNESTGDFLIDIGSSDSNTFEASGQFIEEEEEEVDEGESDMIFVDPSSKSHYSNQHYSNSNFIQHDAHDVDFDYDDDSSLGDQETNRHRASEDTIRSQHNQVVRDETGEAMASVCVQKNKSNNVNEKNVSRIINFGTESTSYVQPKPLGKLPQLSLSAIQILIREVMRTPPLSSIIRLTLVIPIERAQPSHHLGPSIDDSMELYSRRVFVALVFLADGYNKQHFNKLVDSSKLSKYENSSLKKYQMSLQEFKQQDEINVQAGYDDAIECVFISL